MIVKIDFTVYLLKLLMLCCLKCDNGRVDRVAAVFSCESYVKILVKDTGKVLLMSNAKEV